MPRRYKDVESCRSEIQEYIEELQVGTDDEDLDKRDESSTTRYKQDLRWFDHWLDDTDINSVSVDHIETLLTLPVELEFVSSTHSQFSKWLGR